MKKLICIFTALALLAGLCGCASDKPSYTMPDLSLETTAETSGEIFAGTGSTVLTLSAEGAEAVLAAVESQAPDYIYKEHYQTDDVLRRLDFDASVENHQYCALDENGALTAAHLAALVRANNTAWLDDEPFGLENVEDEYVQELCGLIVEVVDRMAESYPDLDLDRIYCNLGNLKILYKPGMLDYAQMNQDMIMSISQTSANILQTLKGEHAFRNVIIHETMHILQLGCVCEDIENCTRRAGICVYWGDFLLNTTDWTWLAEGSAERNMCRLTGESATTYQYKMDYICSFTLSLLLREEVEPDTIQTLCFYSDPQLLFDAFGCTTDAEKEEIVNMMITMEILQSQPNYFFLTYAEATGTDPRDEEETLNQFYYSLKPAVCITLAREFFTNLTAYIQENAIPAGDLCFLLALFESTMNQHLRYTDESRESINAPFLSAYGAMRTALFQVLEAEDPELDMAALYESYSVRSEDGSLNASFADLSPEKQEFLAERVLWLEGLRGLGVRVPF